MATTLINTVTREELIALVVADTGLLFKDVRAIIGAWEVNQAKKLKMGKSVRTGLYTISTYQRAQYNGMNPKTREPIIVRPKTMVKFVAIQALMDAVN